MYDLLLRHLLEDVRWVKPTHLIFVLQGAPILIVVILFRRFLLMWVSTYYVIVGFGVRILHLMLSFELLVLTTQIFIVCDKYFRRAHRLRLAVVLLTSIEIAY